jgi:nucleoside-diphosphate-sugar epimerase
MGRRLIRPRCIEANICTPGLEVSRSNINEALLEQVDAVIHCAASLRFEEDEAGEEPLRTNLSGTKNVVAFARDWGIPHFHHVSTAYVCGQRQGRVLETELDRGQGFHNVYEQSKFLAEQSVRSAAGFLTQTIFRPSIVIGDSATGFSSTFHTIYSILRFLRALPESNAGNLDWIFQRLQLSGYEGKNLVPVDWVSRMTVDLLDRPEAWGKTYHLTNPKPLSVNQLSEAITESIALKRKDWDAMALPPSIVDAQVAYQMHVDAYRGYLADDPTFDTEHIQRALPEWTEPMISHTSLVRMLSFAIEHRFRDPTVPIPRGIDSGEVEATLDRAWLTGVSSPNVKPDVAPIWSLRISGLGGGNWVFGDSKAAPEETREAWSHMSIDTWKKLLSKESTLEQAVRDGALLIVGSPEERHAIRKHIHRLIDWCAANRVTPASNEENAKVIPLHQPNGGRRFA